jgi:hypothetical protein
MNGSRVSMCRHFLPIVLAAALMISACESEPSNVRIIRGNAAYFNVAAKPNTAYAWGTDDLGLVDAFPVDDLRVELEGNPGSTLSWSTNGTALEAHIFREDPQQTWDAVFAYDLDQANPQTKFQQLTQPRLRGVAFVWPDTHPKLNIPGFPTKTHTSAPLECSQFMPPTPTPPGSVQACGTGPLHAVRVYDRGGCAKRVKMADVIDPLVVQVWEDFNSAVAGAGGGIIPPLDFGKLASAKKNYLRVASMLMHEPGTSLTNMRGGFAAYLDFHVDFYGGDVSFGAWVGGQRIKAVYGYAFQLSDGLLTLSPPRFHRNTDNSGVHVDIAYDGLHKAMQGEVRTRFAEAARFAQQIPIPDLAGVEFPCSQVAQCSAAVGTLVAGLSQAKTKQHITDAEQAKLTPLVQNLNSNWACATHRPKPAPGEQKVCRLKLKAQRLNVFPASIELVWFNGNERPTTAAFALSKILQASNRVKELCDPSIDAPLESLSVFRYTEQFRYAVH